MRSTRIILAAALLALSFSSALTATSRTILSEANAQTVAPAPAPAPQVSAPVADPKPGTFVTVRDGVATVSGGSLIGEAIMWVALLVGTPLAGFLVRLIMLYAKKLGIDASDSDRKRLQEIVENGLALAAQRVQANLKDKLTLEVRSKVSVEALQYVNDHGAETIKSLGFDINDPKAMEAVQARIAKALDEKVVPLLVPVGPAPGDPLTK